MARTKKYVIVGLIGSFFLVGSFLSLYNFFKIPDYDREWSGISATTTGIVVEAVPSYRNRIRVVYPTVEYALPDGTTTTFRSREWFLPSTFPEGTAVPVTYSVADPVNYSFINNDPDSSSTKGASIALLVIYFLLAAGCFGWIIEDVGYYKKFDKIM